MLPQLITMWLMSVTLTNRAVTGWDSSRPATCVGSSDLLFLVVVPMMELLLIVFMAVCWGYYFFKAGNRLGSRRGFRAGRRRFRR